MVTQAPFRVYFSDGETVIRQVTEDLEVAGLRVVKSFDLRAACASAFGENICPHHGTSPCDCQLVVLLVYGIGTLPISLVLHSHRGQTELQWDDAPASRPSLENQAYIIWALNGGIRLPLDVDQEANADAG